MLDHYIFWLDVAVDDVLVVHVLEGRDHLLAIIGGFLFGELGLGYGRGTFSRKSLKRHCEQY